MRSVQRPRLWALRLKAIQATLAKKRHEGRWLSPTPYLRSLMVSSQTAWRQSSAQLDGVARSVGHEGVVVVGGQQGQLGAGVGLVLRAMSGFL